MRLAAIATIALALGVSSSLLFKRLKKEPGPGEPRDSGGGDRVGFPRWPQVWEGVLPR